MNRSSAAFDSGPQVPRASPDWKGTPRYQVRRCIGAGATGAVYEAFDRERGHLVAVKKLRHFSPSSLYLFKQEFRALSGVVHRNLVRLYELVANEANDVFFAMELVLGPDIAAHVRDHGGVDISRLRAVVAQLALGVHALHEAGKLHRDIKPSNVLVTAEGRVVLLDFGVATDLFQRAGTDSSPDEGSIVGTAAYMSPEQAAGAPPSPASDWYAVGAVLFEALVGSPPFVGSVSEVLRAKASVDPPHPSRRARDVPEDLDALCAALLQRAPDMRPTGPDVLRALGAEASGHAPSSPAARPSFRPKALVGREAHLHALRDAFEAARSGRCVTVRVWGPLGVGKTSLVRAFLDELSSRDDAVVLSGRAHERESVPYKAIDGWMDDLSRTLLGLSEAGTPIALPDDVWALSRLFPVLRRVPEIADSRALAIGDPLRVRQRAFAALRRLLAALSGQRTVVVHVDDAEWGDSDSADLFLELLRPPEAPPLLLILSHRDDLEESSPFLAELRASWPEGADARRLVVRPLDEADAQRLAMRLLGSGEAAQSAAAAVARESRGSPFLVEELARNLPTGATAGDVLTLEQSVSQRLASLEEQPRHLLEVLAVGGRPLPVSVVARAANALSDVDDSLAKLQASRLVRLGLRDGCEMVEPTHGRICEVVVSRLPADSLRAQHARLAEALEESPGADPEAIAIHLSGAGAKQRAVVYAERAAERAIGHLAFERAVQLLRLALAGAEAGSDHAQALRLQLAEALSWTGRNADAAQAYLEVARHAPEDRKPELERSAAAQFLISGRIDEGASVLRGVLSAVGESAPRSNFAAIFRLVFYRLWLLFLGLRHPDRPKDGVSERDRVHIETMYAVAMGFSTVNVLLGACTQARFLILALRMGDREQVLRAAILEAGHHAMLGGPPGKRERAALDFVASLAAKLGGAEADARVQGVRGMALFLRGRWREAVQALDASMAKSGQGGEIWQAMRPLFATRGLFFAGDIRELARRHALLEAEAESRGDLYTAVNLATTTSIGLRLIADDPAGARAQAQEALAHWSQSAFFVQHCQAMAFMPDIDLYEGEGEKAYEALLSGFPALRRSLLLKVQFVRGIVSSIRGRCAVASIVSRPELRAKRVAEARSIARRMKREGMAWMSVLGAVVEAGAENAAGERARAMDALKECVAGSDAAGMALHAAMARHRLGELSGGDEGRELVESGRNFMLDEGVANPDKWLRVHFPGTWKA